MRAFVTGGTGFVGGAVVRRLIAAGHEVVALVRPESNTRQLDGLPVRHVVGDVKDAASLRAGMAGCDWVFHVAALYSYWGHAWEEFYQVNVEGTRHVLEAAQAAGVKRVVHTSSVAVLGRRRDNTPGDEETPCTLADMVCDYERSKFLGEQVARDCARQGLPVVIVNPGAPVGVGDHKPTQTGKMILDFLHGRIPAYVDTGLAVVDVDDAATGHLLAAERGRVGERYILAGENLTLKQILDTLAEVSGRPKVRLRMPHFVALAWAYAEVARARLNSRHIPSATPEMTRVARYYVFFDSAKAMRELGFSYVPAREALRKAVEWYRSHGYIS